MMYFDFNCLNLLTIGDIVRDSSDTEFEIINILPHRITPKNIVLLHPEQGVSTSPSYALVLVGKKTERITVLNEQLSAARVDAAECLNVLQVRLLENKQWSGDLATAVRISLTRISQIEKQLYALDPESSYLT